MSEPTADDDVIAFTEAVLDQVGGLVQHTREPVMDVSFDTVLRASCLQCGWSSTKDIEDNAVRHIAAFRHAVMIVDMKVRVVSLATTEDVKL